MKLFLLPISTRRALIFCSRPSIRAEPSTTYLSKRLDQLPPKISSTWASWEKAEKGWKKQVTFWGNQLFKRIPYEEWGLKSIPTLTARRKGWYTEGYEEDGGMRREQVEVLFPGRFLKEGRVRGVLERLAVERQGLHAKRMWWSGVGAPLTLPFALIPVIPNLPGFYLLFRAWSHWKALRGAQHLEFLVKDRIITHTPSAMLDELYAAGLMHPSREHIRQAETPTQRQIDNEATKIETQITSGKEDVMMLQRWNGKLMAERLELPELEVEVERAVEQVEKSLQSKQELQEEKTELDRAKRENAEKAGR